MIQQASANVLTNKKTPQNIVKADFPYRKSAFTISSPYKRKDTSFFYDAKYLALWIIQGNSDRQYYLHGFPPFTHPYLYSSPFKTL